MLVCQSLGRKKPQEPQPDRAHIASSRSRNSDTRVGLRLLEACTTRERTRKSRADFGSPHNSARRDSGDRTRARIDCTLCSETLDTA